MTNQCCGLSVIFCGFISLLIGRETINIPEIFSSRFKGKESWRGALYTYLLSFFPQIQDFIYWTVLIFLSIYFECRDTENKQFPFSLCPLSVTREKMFAWSFSLEVFQCVIHEERKLLAGLLGCFADMFSALASFESGRLFNKNGEWSGLNCRIPCHLN